MATKVVKWSDGEWKRLLADAIRSPTKLAEELGLQPRQEDDLAPWSREFPVLVPRGFAAKMLRGQPRDPLLLQVLAQAVEGEQVEGFGRDPLQEDEVSPAPGVLHKYEGRVLLVVTGACPVHCRYCFRRHFPYAEHGLAGERLGAALEYIAGDESIAEVILSGGDPLSLPDDQLPSRRTPMPRPVTLFTGQWADLPLEELCRKATAFGYDGLELACWGDHVEVEKVDAEYAAAKTELLQRHDLELYAISNHLVGQAVCDHIDARPDERRLRRAIG